MSGLSEQADTALPNRDGETDIRPWRPEDGDRRCQRCGHPNVVWFTDADSWNTAMGNESGILCVRCFVGTYEAIYGATIWSLLPERPGLLSEFSRGMEAGRAATVAGAARAMAEQRAAIESDVAARVAAAREEAAAKIEPLLSATSGHARGEVSEWGPQVYCRKCGESWPCEVAEARDALAADIRKGADRG